MPYPAPFHARSQEERRIVQRAREAAAIAAEHASRHDRDGSFPVEGLAALAASGYLAAVLPTELGGEDASVASFVLGSLELGKGDAALALVVAMHGVLLGRVRDARSWPAAVFESLAREIVAAQSGPGALINSLATEPETGSPSRGALPATVAEPLPEGGFRITGRKTFSSGSPVLRWATVSTAVAAADGPGTPATFLVPMDDPRISIQPSWDVMGMRATRSDTVVFDGVEVAASSRLPAAAPPGPGAMPVPHERAWSLAVSAVYLGVAEAARDFAVDFARNRKPSALGGKSIGTVPHIRRKVGDMDALLYQARAILVGCARMWDGGDDNRRTEMDLALAVAKMTASNAAVQVTELAMRLVGGSSMDRAFPLERHYRDVRGGLHHPPQDDATLEALARAALD